ncbi:hypothetical protein COLO4_34623 [Corchorus olitorius]|uniref:Uncharacterized protein n=1 Tax=Corchorus olitorius TaxID=93759 RepID=A0A1R3GK39_9ROSI|nr:hypothetical protein COLO4_34623 [Corchorus olitorius]
MARIKPQALLIQSKRKKGPTRISATTILFCNLIVLLVVLSLIATYRHWLQRAREQTGSGLSTSEHVTDVVDSNKYDLPGFAVLNTSKGYITIELFKDGSPQTVDKFLDLWGEDVVQEIEEVDTDEHYRPKSPVGIIDVTLKQET